MLRRTFVSLILIVSLLFSFISCSDDNDNYDNDDSIGSTSDAGDDSENSEKDPTKDGETSVNDKDESENEESPDVPSDSEKEETEDPGDDNGEPEAPTVNFVYSVNSKKFHLPTCYYVSAMKPETKIEFTGTMAELTNKGMLPCKSCKPDPDFDYEKVEEGITEEEIVDYNYVINSKSMVFHIAGCGSIGAMNEENKQFSYETREELIIQGYSPCGNCHP